MHRFSVHVLWIIVSVGVVAAFAVLALCLVAYMGYFLVAMVLGGLKETFKGVPHALGWDISVKRGPPRVPSGPLTGRQEKRLRRRGMTKVGDTWQFFFSEQSRRRVAAEEAAHRSR